MNTDPSGYLKLLAALLFFGAWCWISTQHEIRLETKLEQAREELRIKAAEHDAALNSLQAAHMAQEKIRNEMDARKKALESALADRIGWSDIDIPDDVLDRLRESAAGQTYSFQPSGDPAGRCENPAPRPDENCRGYGADNR